MSYIKIWIHAVWGTKSRIPILKSPILQQVCEHIKSNAKNKGIYVDRINGHDEHIHVLMLLRHDNSISKQMQLLKGESSFWVNKNNMLRTELEWADKYFAASVSEDKLDKVRAYIDNQQIHHQKQTFLEEYKLFIQGLGYSEENFG